MHCNGAIWSANWRAGGRGRSHERFHIPLCFLQPLYVPYLGTQLAHTDIDFLESGTPHCTPQDGNGLLHAFADVARQQTAATGEVFSMTSWASWLESLAVFTVSKEWD